MRSKKSINWDPIKRDYLNFNYTLKDLAEKYNISEVSIKKKSSAEKWFSLKKSKYQNLRKIKDSQESNLVKLKIKDRVELLLDKVNEKMHHELNVSEIKEISNIVKDCYDLLEKINAGKNDIADKKKMVVEQ